MNAWDEWKELEQLTCMSCCTIFAFACLTWNPTPPPPPRSPLLSSIAPPSPAAPAAPSVRYKMSTRFMLNMFAGPNKFVDLRKAWKCFTVEGGTNNWIQKLAKGFRERCRVNTAVESVKRVTGKDGQPRVEVTTEAHGTETYDHVVSGKERVESERRGERDGAT